MPFKEKPRNWWHSVECWFHILCMVVPRAVCSRVCVSLFVSLVIHAVCAVTKMKDGRVVLEKRVQLLVDRVKAVGHLCQSEETRIQYSLLRQSMLLNFFFFCGYLLIDDTHVSCLIV